MTPAPQAKTTERSPAPFQLRGGAFTLLVLRLDDPKDPVLFQALRDKVMQAPNFFRHAPVVIDLQNLADAAPFNMAELGRRLRQHELVPIGVQNGTEEQNRAAVNCGWSIFPDGRATPAREAAPTAEPTATATPAAASPSAAQQPPAAVPPAVAAPAALETAAANDPIDIAAGPEEAAVLPRSRMLTQPVRSGQQVYAHGGDLVVLASISPGAELLADGNIHVYGALRGRAIAGVSGDTAARIFCRSLEAELVSIAGYWQVRDDMPDTLIGKAVQIFLDGERIAIEPLA